MKKILIIVTFIVVAVISTEVSGQTIQEKKQTRILNREIKKTEREIDKIKKKNRPDYSIRIGTLTEEVKGLKKDFLDSNNPVDKEKFSQMVKVRESEIIFLANKMVDRKVLVEELELLEEKYSELRLEKNTMFYYYSTSLDVPKEATPRVENRRKRGNYLRREELVLSKIENNISAVDPKQGDVGYKIIVNNDYSMPITFQFSPLNGGDKIAVNVSSRKTQVIYLLPGVYSVLFKNGGRLIGGSEILTVDGSKHVYRGEDCFGFAYMPQH